MIHFGAFLAVEPLTLILSVVFTQPTVSLPEAALLTPCFSIQTPSALAEFRLRQGHPELIPQEALCWVAHWTPEPMQNEDVLV